MVFTKKSFLIFPVMIIMVVVAGILVISVVVVYGQQQEQQSTTPSTSPSPPTSQSTEFRDAFNLENCTFDSRGSNTYFILEPGHQSLLEAQENGEKIELVITVLNETNVVDGIETRVVEERESEDGELVEISRNYFAICKPTNDIFYFGEDVNDYENGEIVSHGGAWLAGTDGARPGMIMPGKLEVGHRYYQEIASGIAEDRAEIISLNDTLKTPAGEFTNVLKTEETNPLNPDEREFKFYAPGIGLIQEETLQLINYTTLEE